MNTAVLLAAGADPTAGCVYQPMIHRIAMDGSVA